jgi:hypothetical protein
MPKLKYEAGLSAPPALYLGTVDENLRELAR